MSVPAVPSSLNCYTLGFHGRGTAASPFRGAVGPAETAESAARWLDRGLAVCLARDAAEAQRVADRLASAATDATPEQAATADERPAGRGRRTAFDPFLQSPPPPSEERPMATNTASAPKQSKSVAKRVAAEKAAVAVDPQVELAEQREQLAIAEISLAELSQWRPEYAATLAAAEELRARVATLEVRTLPMPSEMALMFGDFEVAIDAINVTGNHRERVDDAGLQQLARSIQIHGLQQKIGLRGDVGDDGPYELIFGSRRLAACRLAGMTRVSAKIYRSDLTPAQVEILRTIENFGRQELTHAERAIGVARTIDAIEQTLVPAEQVAKNLADAETGPIDSIGSLVAWAGTSIGRDRIEQVNRHGAGGLDSGLRLLTELSAAGGVHAYVGQQLGYPTRWVQDHAYVAQLGGKSRELLGAGRITIGHARELAKLGDKSVADRIAGECARSENGTGGRDVAWTHRQVVEHLRSLRGVGWELDTAFGEGVPGCTGYACKACRFNSKSDPDLFGGAIADEPEAGTCTNEACFKAKTEIVEKALVKLVVKAKPKVESGKIEATENGIRELVPRFVRASTAARRVKRETTVAEPAKPDAPVALPESAKATAEEVAQSKLDAAIADRNRAIEEAMKVAVNTDETGNKLAAMATLQYVDWEAFSDYGERPTPDDLDALRDAADKTRQRKLVARVIADDQWARHVFENFEWNDEALQIFVDAWALKVPPAPTLADFLPKAKAVKSAARAAKADAAPVVEIDAEAAMDQAVLHCTHRVEDGASRWKKLRDAGATDAEIRERLRAELGTGGSSSPGPDGYDYDMRGGTLTITMRRPIARKMSGKALVDRVRRVLAIPPAGEAKPDAASVVVVVVDRHDNDVTIDAAPTDSLSPAMRQHAAFKQQYPDYILFFRVGDFYEMYGEDARTAGRVLGITVTHRSDERATPMAGVPFHSVEVYLRQMIAAGHRVALAEQADDPKNAGGVVGREVTRLITPGTLENVRPIDATAIASSSLDELAGCDAVRLGGIRLATSPGWRNHVEPIGNWPDLSPDALEAAMQLAHIGPRSPREDASPADRIATSTVGPILRAGDVDLAVTLARHETGRITYELHPLTSGSLVVYEDWAALRERHPKCAPEEIPLAGLRVETSTGFARTIANDNALLVAVPTDRAKQPPAEGVTLDDAIRAGEAEFGTPAGDDFAEYPTIHSPADFGVTTDVLARADCAASLIAAGRDGVADWPTVTLVTDRRDRTEYAVVGRRTLNGRECWRLLQVAMTGDGSKSTFTGTSAGERAAKGLFDGAVVRVGRSHRILIEGDDDRDAPMYVAIDAPPPRQSHESER